MLETALLVLAIVAGGFLAVVVAFLVLLAMPKSPLRDWLTELVKRLMATGAAGVYTLSPIDLIPDVIPVLGQMDDLAVLLMLAYYWYTLTKPAPGARGGSGGRGGRPGPPPPGQGPVIDIQAEEVR